MDIPTLIDSDTQIRFEEITIGTKPDKVFFGIHGYGSNYKSLVSVVKNITLNNIIFILPNGQQKCEGSKNVNMPASEGRQWFGLQNLAPHVIAPMVNATAKTVIHFINNQLNRLGIQHSKAVVFGFSQGAMLSSNIGVQIFPALGGAISCSGCVMPIDEGRIISKTPHTLIHGRSDTVMDCSLSEIGIEELKQAGASVDGYFIDGLDHSINKQALEIINKKLCQYLDVDSKS